MKGDSFLVFNKFSFKIIIFVLTVLGCLGEALLLDASLSNNLILMSSIFTVIGRCSIPFVCFCAIEGMIFTKSKKIYIFKILCVEILCLSLGAIGQFVMALPDTSNFITDILIALIFIALLQSKNEKLYFIALFPLIYVGLSYFATGYETLHAVDGLKILWFPNFLRCRYPLLSFMAIVGGYFSIYVLKRFSFNGLNLRKKENKKVLENKEYRFGFNIFFSIIYAFSCSIFYIISVFTNNQFNVFHSSYQMYTLIPLMLIVFYNGKLGYNKKWFSIFSYLHYPVAISIIFGIVLAVIL